MDEPGSKVLVNELMQHCKFLMGQGVDRTERRAIDEDMEASQ